MATFKDNTGREWLVKLHYLNAGTVKDRTGVDLLKGDIQPLVDDLAMLCRVLWVLCEPQAGKLGIEPEQFAESLIATDASDPLDAATDALLEAIFDFFPKARREVLKKTFAMYQRMRERAVKVVDQVVSDPATEAKLDEAVRKHGESVSNWLVSSASTPDPAPSAS